MCVCVLELTFFIVIFLFQIYGGPQGQNTTTSHKRQNFKHKTTWHHVKAKVKNTDISNNSANFSEHKLIL